MPEQQLLDCLPSAPDCLVVKAVVPSPIVCAASFWGQLCREDLEHGKPDDD